ncbi:MAG: aminotransferase class I/II-fold pyridoxal phosphate-dependent enzyme, partial [Polaribacter sp.]|nr:aminotransferase class I/II-fold pyridoxal phosphate-dependent enzyme [Polaribacter sp.]
MTKDLFERIKVDKGPLGKWAEQAEGYYVFPKLQGPISNRMSFNGKKVITWSINDYLGLANHPEVLKADAAAAAEHGMAYPMGARMMSGHTDFHEQLERECAEFVHKEKAYFVGHMVFELLKVFKGQELPTDRDNFKYKRIELSGVMLYQLFREYY